MMVKRRMALAVGFTLVEVILAGMVLVIAISAIMGAYISQVTLNEHARNLSLAMNDATRVMEQIRQQNSPCAGALPTANTAGGWDAWLQAAGKSVSPTAPQLERVTVTTGAVANPLEVTVAVCWRHRNRTIGECQWTGAVFTDTEVGDGDGTVESPAMLTTLVTCR